MSNKTDEETCKIYEHKYLQLVCYWFVDKLHFAADFVAIIINTAAIIECIGTTSKAPFRFANRFEKLDCFHYITSLTEETNLPMHFGFIRCILRIFNIFFHSWSNLVRVSEFDSSSSSARCLPLHRYSNHWLSVGNLHLSGCINI